MPSKKLTDRFVQTICFIGKTTEYIDTSPASRGLRLRVNKTSKSFSSLYVAPNGKRKRYTLGTYPALSLKQARIAFTGLRANIENGKDPSQVRKDEQLKAREGMTFEDIAALYMRRHAEIKLKPKTISEYQNQLNSDIYPHIGNCRVDNGDLTKRDLIICIDKVVDRGALVKANRVTALLKAIFRWAGEEDYIQDNPSFGIRRRCIESPRARVLDDNEIVKFWNDFGSEGMTEPVAIAAKLELVLGHRTSEITQQLKSNIHLSDTKSYWLIADTKNKLSHKLPLSDLAVDLINRAIELSGECEFLFPSPHNRFRPIGPHVVTKAILRTRGALGFHFTSHDLRRTMNTRLAAMGIDREMRKRILNHKSSGDGNDINEAVYNWHKYESETREILNAWGNKLIAIIEGIETPDNVVTISNYST